MMINLYAETIRDLAENCKTEDDIRWVGTKYGGYRLDLLGGLKKLFDFEYDNGYGGEEIRLDLIVVGDDWWLERHEYDGSEWWEFKTMPQMPVTVIQEPDIKDIVSGAYFWNQEGENKTYETNIE